MKEISLFILDIAGNSIRAKATVMKLTILEDDASLTFSIEDDGCGMDADFLARVTDPFSTTRTTRKVGLGIPFLKMQAELTGGAFSITSKSEREHPEDHGTTTTATFMKNSVDYVPLGDIVETVCTLIHGMGSIDLEFLHRVGEREIALNSAELRQILGDDVKLSEPEVIDWIRQFLADSYNEE